MSSIIFLILISVLLRLMPHYPNFAPITAIALFAGAKLPGKYAVFVPIAVMLISDYFLGFHSSIGFVYGSFIISALIGVWLKKHYNLRGVIGASVIASLQFFIITNFGVWLVGSMYPHNLSGLIQSYIMGLPFYRGTLLGDLFYTGMFFGGYELAKYLIIKSSPSKHSGV